MDNPANPTAVSEPPWHVSDKPPVSNPEPSVPSEVPPIPEPEIPRPPESPPIPEPIVPSPEISVSQTPGETSLPPLPPPPPPFPTGGSETPFVIEPAPPDASLGGPAPTTTIKPPKKGRGSKAVLASLIFFFIAIATGVGFYFFQKGGLPFKLGKKAAPGACCIYGGSPTGCAANENCVNDPAAAQQAGCIYSYVCKSVVTTWATQNCADVWYNGGYGNIPSDAQCCCRIVNPGPPCDEDCRFAYEASYNSSMGTVIQFCDTSSGKWLPSWQSRDNTDCDEKGYCQGIDDPLISQGTCSVCNNKWRKPSVTLAPTPPTGTTPTPTPKTTPTPTPKATPTPTPKTTPTPTTFLTPPPPPVCLTVEAYKKGTTGLANIVPGDTIVITVTSTDAVTDMAVRIRTGAGGDDHIRFSNMVGTWLEAGRKWQYEYTIPVGEVGNYTVDGFVKAGGVWR